MASNDAATFFGRALAAFRGEQGLKRNDLKERSGLSYPYIAEIENGHKYPGQQAIEKLARALDLSPSDLLARAEALQRVSGDALSGDIPQMYASFPTSSKLLEGPGGSPSNSDDDLVMRLSDQVYKAIEPRVREWLQMEIRMAVREELTRQRGHA